MHVVAKMYCRFVCKGVTIQLLFQFHAGFLSGDRWIMALKTFLFKRDTWGLTGIRFDTHHSRFAGVGSTQQSQAVVEMILVGRFK